MVYYISMPIGYFSLKNNLMTTYYGKSYPKINAWLKNV